MPNDDGKRTGYIKRKELWTTKTKEKKKVGRVTIGKGKEKKKR